jgi:hypothetical protein
MVTPKQKQTRRDKNNVIIGIIVVMMVMLAIAAMIYG